MKDFRHSTATNPVKGTWRGPCNRTACQKPGATFFNQSTRAFYCGDCAQLINRANAREALEFYGDPRLCLEVHETERGEGPGVIRYAVTHIEKDGRRTLAQAAQGRYTYDTPYPAERWIKDALENNSESTLRSVYGFPLEVRPVECWPGHHDPKGIYFDI